VQSIPQLQITQARQQPNCRRKQEKFYLTSSQDVGFYIFIVINIKIFTFVFVSKNKSAQERKYLEEKKITLTQAPFNQ